MTDFEDQIRRALERKEPSADFAARVMARAAAVQITDRRPPVWRRWAAAGLAASLCLGALGLEMERRERMREQGQAARAQLIQALEITSSKLQRIHKKVQGELR